MKIIVKDGDSFTQVKLQNKEHTELLAEFCWYSKIEYFKARAAARKRAINAAKAYNCALEFI